jgi:amino acid adenylation domain-containing protein
MTIGSTFSDRVDSAPGHLALVDGERSWTYAELDASANRLANAILSADPKRIRPHAGVLLPQSAEAAIATMAIAQAGRVAVMLDPGAPSARLRDLIGRLGPAIVITDQTRRAALARCEPDGVLVIDVDDAPLGQPSTRPEVVVDPSEPAGITFTSGSTAVPKGVVRSHRSLVAAVERQHREGRYALGDHVGLVFEYQFAAGRAAMLGALLSGATLEVFDVRREGPAALVDWLVAHRISSASLSASLVEAMLDATPADRGLPDLTRVTFTADVLRRNVVERLRLRLGADAVIMNLYGSSEAGGVARFTITADTVLESDLVPVGQVREHVSVAIDTPDDEGVGEIVVTSTNVALGYLGDAAASAVFSTAQDNRRTFRTGDLGRLFADGTLEYRGRIDHRVKVRGHTIDPSEVHAALLSLPAVRDAAVTLDDANARRPRLVAYVVGKSGADVSVTALRRGLRDALPTYMIPAAFVILDAVPRTARGKVDRAALPAPRAGRPDLREAYEPPANATEQVVADIFGRLLELDRVGRRDEFFDLGGDSLAAAEAMTAMSSAFGRDLPLAVFLDASTPAALAERFDAADAATTTRLVPLQAGGGGAPIVCVHGGGGQVLSFASLGERLPHDRPFVAVQMSADDRARRLFRVRHLARSYADEIRAAHVGPYVVAGHSFGGLLALEITRRLIELGDDVAACVLLDTPRPHRARLLRRLITGARPAEAINGVEVASWKELLYAAHAAIGLRPKPHRLTTERMIAAMWGTLFYRIRPVSFPVVVLQAGRTTADLGQWRSIARGRFALTHVPGDHQSILMPPQVDELAGQFDAAMRDL